MEIAKYQSLGIGPVVLSVSPCHETQGKKGTNGTKETDFTDRTDVADRWDGQDRRVAWTYRRDRPAGRTGGMGRQFPHRNQGAWTSSRVGTKTQILVPASGEHFPNALIKL